MMFCSYCGSQLNDTDRFCPNCGASLQDAVTEEETTVTASGSIENDYEVVLADLGGCARRTCNDLLEDLMGYSDAEAEQLINNIPVRIGYAMTLQQAKTLAQGLTEYGVQVSVLQDGEYVDVIDDDDDTASSIFNSDGSLIGKALAILGTLTSAQRVREYKTYKKPGLFSRIFHTIFRRNDPPVHVRRNVPHQEPPREDHRFDSGRRVARRVSEPPEYPRQVRPQQVHQQFRPQASHTQQNRPHNTDMHTRPDHNSFSQGNRPGNHQGGRPDMGPGGGARNNGPERRPR